MSYIYQNYQACIYTDIVDLVDYERYIMETTSTDTVYVKLERFTVTACLRKIVKLGNRYRQVFYYRKIMPVGRLGWLAPARQLVYTHSNCKEHNVA